MLVIEHTPKGWSAPEIKPYSPLQLDPASSCFHYCPNVFEGMKAYRGLDGKPRLFRPELNMQRLLRSSQRVSLPPFDPDALLVLLKKLVAIDQRWIPSQSGQSLYIRPTIIGTRPYLGVTPSSDYAMLYVIMTPVQPIFTPGGADTSVSLLAVEDAVRAWPGGTGDHKVGGNYGPTFNAQKIATQKGYQQALWLFGPNHQICEAGVMNFFAVVKRDDGGLDVLTPTLDGTILPGITRRSCLELLDDHASGKMLLPKISPDVALYPKECTITMQDLIEWNSQGKLLETFGVGTAAIVQPVRRIGFQGGDIVVPHYEGGFGPVSRALIERLLAIQEGRETFKDWSVPLEV
ncbi:branched-chain amino acid aminotransferase II [Fistulina hepatica ATCC 64428]|nr:branched-chain amino acid aminotransferase II [Fistulina hepatica ATCC 64428]